MEKEGKPAMDVIAYEENSRMEYLTENFIDNLPRDVIDPLYNALGEAFKQGLKYGKELPKPAQLPNVQDIHTVGQLRDMLCGLPPEKLIIFQVCGTDGTAWSLRGSFCRGVTPGNVSLLILQHPMLRSLPVLTNSEEFPPKETGTTYSGISTFPDTGTPTE